MAGFAREDQPAISKRFRQHAPRSLRTWNGVAIAAKEVRVLAPIGDDRRPQRPRSFSAKNTRKFGAGMGLGRCRTGAG